jgi:hypothetical protein
MPGGEAHVLVEREAAHPRKVGSARGKGAVDRERRGSRRETEHSIRLAGYEIEDDVGGEFARGGLALENDYFWHG